MHPDHACLVDLFTLGHWSALKPLFSLRLRLVGHALDQHPSLEIDPVINSIVISIPPSPFLVPGVRGGLSQITVALPIKVEYHDERPEQPERLLGLCRIKCNEASKCYCADVRYCYALTDN